MSDLAEKLVPKLQEMADQFDRIERDLSDPAVLADHQRIRALSIQRAALADMVARFRKRQALLAQAAEHEAIIADGSDKELAALAASELPALLKESDELLEFAANDLVTADDRAIGSVILEVRAGTGGAEAALWAGDLLEMYQRFAGRKGWDFSPMDHSPGEQGGIRQAIASVQGQGVWQGLGYEGGVHCVKRVPATETQGRVHTSTATVAVLPEPEKVQMEIPESDVKIDVTTAQGPGGQNVNKVSTAVHLIHIPTGIEVRMQESKSQQQNRAKAWQLLRARVYDFHQRAKDAQRAADRSKMIGTGERSERIRTYRYKESVVVDHRLPGSYALPKILDGELDPIIAALVEQDRMKRLAAL